MAGGTAARFTATFSVLRIRDVRLLWTSQALSEIGDWGARLALAVLVYDRSQSPLWSAVTLAVSYLPYLLSPILTPLAQRWSLRSMMIGADLLRMSVFALIAFPLPTWALLVLAFASALATPPFEAARVAVTPEAAGDERMPDAIALTNITFQVAQVIGFATAGLLMFLVGPEPAILLNAATFGVSALLLVGMRAGRHRPEPEPLLEKPMRAVRTITRTVLLRRIIVLVLLLAFSDAAVNAMLPVFVRTNDYSELLLSALVITAPLVGAVSGSVVPREGANAYLLRVSALLTLTAGGGAGILFFLIGVGSTWQGAAIAIVAVTAYGVTIAADIPTMTAAMRQVDDDLRASLVAVVQPALMGIQAVGAVLAGAVALALPASITMSASLVLPVAYSIWVLLRTKATPATIDLTEPHGDDTSTEAASTIDVTSAEQATQPSAEGPIA